MERESSTKNLSESYCLTDYIFACCEEIITPDYLLGETAVDSVDVLLQRGARLSLDLLHFLQPPAGHEQTASLAVMRQHLWKEGRNTA